MTYDYLCECGHRFEATHKLSDPTPDCPKCDQPEPAKQISKGTTFRLKTGGCGWAGSGYSGTS